MADSTTSPNLLKDRRALPLGCRDRRPGAKVRRNIAGLPTTLVYDRSGVPRKKIIGFEYTEAVEAELKALL
jgi:hypothetical protein